MKRTCILFLVSLFLPACAAQTSPTDPSSSAEAVADRWTPVVTTVRTGDIQVTVTQTGVEVIHVTGVQDRTGVFAVRLSITNTSPTKRSQYQTWANNASLNDNFGNHYKKLPRPDGMGVLKVPLDPTNPVTDVLLFEAPIATAGYVDLLLPADNINASTNVTFRIKLQTSGERLEAVTMAAAAHEAAANAKIAEIISKEAEAKREQARRTEELLEAKRIAEEKRAEADRIAAEKRSEADRILAKERLEAQRKKDEADLKAEIIELPLKLTKTQRMLEDSQDKLKKVKLTTTRYAYAGKVPDDYFNAETGKYIHYLASQKTKRAALLQEEIESLTSECERIEARILFLKK